MTLLLFLLVLNPQGSDPQTLWQEANRAYQDGRFSDASAQYEVLIEEGIHNGMLHFNLANAYFKQQKIGLAVLHYLKARKYLPGNKDITANLEMAMAQRKDLIEGEDEAFMSSYDSVLRRIDYSTVFTLSAFFLILAAATLLWRIIRPDGGRWQIYVLVISGVWGILFGAGAYLQYNQLTRTDLAVLVAPKAEVRAGPATTEVISFTVHEGVRCRILDKTEGWYRIGLANGYNGWVPQQAVTII
ncbi:MAG: SH3 domain-containing protein [Acidobacteriota bacterium]|nr:SH3 domain-containing protein [Acidobacteriota bacterium]